MNPWVRMILRLLNKAARVAPFLAKAVAKITDALLRENLTAEQIIERRLDSDDAARPREDRPGAPAICAAQQSPSSPSAKQPAPESSAVYPVSSTAARPAAPQRPEPEVVGAPRNKEAPEAGPRQGLGQPDTSFAAQELALRQVERDFSESTKRSQEAIERLNAQDAAVFRFTLAFAASSLLLILVGAYLLFGREVPILGGLTGIVGLLAGTGSAILRKLQTSLREKALDAERQLARKSEYLQAIQATLMMAPGPEREKQLAETAKWLRESVGRTSASSPRPSAAADAER